MIDDECRDTKLSCARNSSLQRSRIAMSFPLCRHRSVLDALLNHTSAIVRSFLPFRSGLATPTDSSSADDPRHFLVLLTHYALTRSLCAVHLTRCDVELEAQEWCPAQPANGTAT